METILVPLDGSERSEQALPYAASIAGLLKAPLCLFHVATVTEQHEFAQRRERLSATYMLYGHDAAGAARSLQHHDEAYLLRKAQALRAAGLEARGEVAFGEPAEAIVAAAARLDAAMIVMSTHGRGSLGRLLMGSAALEVIRNAPCPVLAVREPAVGSPALRTILVPLDGSELAREAVPPAIDLARRAGATVVLLMAPRPIEERPHDLREELLVELNRAMAEAPDVTVATALGEGVAAEAICREAERRGADLIVMTAHGQGGRRQGAIGSVVDRALHATRVPVLVVRAAV